MSVGSDHLVRSATFFINKKQNTGNFTEHSPIFLVVTSTSFPGIELSTTPLISLFIIRKSTTLMNSFSRNQNNATILTKRLFESSPVIPTIIQLRRVYNPAIKNVRTSPLLSDALSLEEDALVCMCKPIFGVDTHHKNVLRRAIQAFLNDTRGIVIRCFWREYFSSSTELFVITKD